jgi:hypothetical protein
MPTLARAYPILLQRFGRHEAHERSEASRPEVGETALHPPRFLVSSATLIPAARRASSPSVYEMGIGGGTYPFRLSL